MTLTQPVRAAEAGAEVSPAVPPLRAFPLTVRSSVRLSPTFLRITLTGGALRHFHACDSLGPRDLRIKLLLPAPGQPLRPPALELSDLSAGWYLRWRALDPAVRGVLRTYTVRAARLTGRHPEIDIDFAIHGGDTDGPGTSWALAARPGSPVTVLGPNTDCDEPAGIEWQPPIASPANRVRVLLVGDETAVPAVGGILGSLPAGYYGHALLEVPSSADMVRLCAPADLKISWLAREGRPHGERLTTAVRALLANHPPGGAGSSAGSSPAMLPEVDIDAEIMWDTRALLGFPAFATGAASRPFYGWIAGEAALVRDLRRLLVSEHGVDRGSVAFMGYWREGRAELS